METEHTLGLSPVAPDVHWQKVSPQDILSGLISLSPNIGLMTRSVNEPGRGVDMTLTWAEDELRLAEQDCPNEWRHASQSIIHAQCAVECLIDTYLERDWLFEQLPDKPALNKKIDLLLKRSTLKIPSTLLATIVSELRHDIIHRYHTSTAKDARVVFEAASSIIAGLRFKSNPCRGRIFAGSLLGGFTIINNTVNHVFGGFSGAFGLTWRSPGGVVFAAAGVPSSMAAAEVRWSPLKKFSVEEHLQLLDWWDCLQGNSVGGVHEAILTLAGLSLPS